MSEITSHSIEVVINMMLNSSRCRLRKLQKLQANKIFVLGNAPDVNCAAAGFDGNGFTVAPSHCKTDFQLGFGLCCGMLRDFAMQNGLELIVAGNNHQAAQGDIFRMHFNIAIVG